MKDLNQLRSDERNQEKKSFWQKVASFYGIIMLFLAILTVLVPFVIYQMTVSRDNEIARKAVISESDSIRNVIFSNISSIESTFKPIEGNSEMAVLINKFQNKSLELCAYWKRTYNSKPFTKILEENPGEITLLLDLDSENEQKMLYLMSDVVGLITDIYTNDKDTSNVFSANYVLMLDIQASLTNKKSILVEYHTKAMSHLNKALILKQENKEFMDEVKLGLAEIDNRKHDPRYLKADDKLFELIVEMNKFNQFRLKE